MVLGIGESVRDLRLAPFFVLGYGTGFYVAVKLKARLQSRPPDLAGKG